MKINDLSTKARYELGYIIYSGLSDVIEKNNMNDDVLKELLDWYGSNVILSYDYLKEKYGAKEK